MQQWITQQKANQIKSFIKVHLLAPFSFFNENDFFYLLNKYTCTYARKKTFWRDNLKLFDK